MDFDSLPEDQPQSIQNQPIKNAVTQPQDHPSFDDLESDEDKYSSPGQTALLVGEKIGQGVLGPVATAAEKGLSKLGVPGLSPEEQEARSAAQPELAAGTELASMVGSQLLGVGEMGLLAKASGAAGEAAKLGRVGTGALKGAIEMAGLSGGDQISQAINHPDTSASMALANIGLSTALGAVGGGLFGKLAPKWMQEYGPAVEQGMQDFKNAAEGTIRDPLDRATSSVFDSLQKLKSNANDIADIGRKYNLPVLEGMISDARPIQAAEDALISGEAPTVAGLSRQKAYNEAYEGAQNLVSDATKAPATMSETETGNALKSSLLDKLNKLYEPIKAMYDEIEPYRQAIPITDKSTGSLTKTIGKIIDEQGLIPGSERHAFIDTFAKGISNVDNLQSLANFRTEVSRSSGPMTKDLAGAIADKLNGVEDRAIKRFSETMQPGPAKDKILGLISQSDAAKSAYKDYRETLSDLGNNLGKKKIYGPQNFMDFIDNLNPQSLLRRSFNENNTEFSSYLAKNFPDEMGIIKNYQRAAVRDAATKDGQLDARKITKNISNMEPEMQKILYSDSERDAIKDSKTYLESFPKSFNPSGTSHMSAFREFFQSPTGATIANLRDFGIQAFIKSFGKAVPGAEKEAKRLIPFLGPKVLGSGGNPAALKTSVEMSIGTIKAARSLAIGTANLFSNGEITTKAASNDRIDKLDKKIEEYSKNPKELLDHFAQMQHLSNDHAQAMAKKMMGAITYLSQQKPKTIQPGPLDAKIEPSTSQMADYDRKLTIADDPMMALEHIKNGTILPQDVQTLTAVHPEYYQQMVQSLTVAMTDHLSKDGAVPYKMRQSLGMFMGQPLDSTMTPQSIQAVQLIYAPKQQVQSTNPAAKNKKNTSKLGKIASSMQTAGQTAEARNAKV